MWKEFFSFRTRCVPHGGRIQTLQSILIASAICLAFAQTASAQTTAFTYQGKLTDEGAAPTGQYDFTFRLFTAGAGGTQVGSDVLVDDVQVTAGSFTVSLDFGSAAFSANADRTLEIWVRPGASSGAYTMLTPRQPLTSSPFAVRTLSATSFAANAFNSPTTHKF